jgi:hypothetical protein
MTNMPALPDEFVECDGSVINDAESPFNGQNTPDLNSTQRFLRGATTSGGIGGSDTHSHSGATDGNTETDIIIAGGASISVTAIDHNHSFTTNSESSLPNFYQVVWIMRIK